MRAPHLHNVQKGLFHSRVQTIFIGEPHQVLGKGWPLRARAQGAYGPWGYMMVGVGEQVVHPDERSWKHTDTNTCPWPYHLVRPGQAGVQDGWVGKVRPPEHPLPGLTFLALITQKSQAW